MIVKLISHTPDPDIICCAAAKLCHEPDERSLDDMVAWLKDNPDHVKRVIEHVIKLGHTSTLEHASFTFGVEDVSRALTHQLVRHRIASYSQQSQRYVNMDEPTYVVPDTCVTKEQEDEFLVSMKEAWVHYDNLRKMGLNKEDARFVLPNACTTKIVITMNARALRNFFSLRCTKHAQWEIRKLANEMLAQVKAVAPVLFSGVEPYVDEAKDG